MNGSGGALILDQSNGKARVFMHGTDKGGRLRSWRRRVAPRSCSRRVRRAEDRAPIVALLDASGNNLVHIGAHESGSWPRGRARAGECGLRFAECADDRRELNISNEFGISRRAVTTVDDGGVMTLQWAGSAGRLSPPRKGVALLVYNPDGLVRATVPAPEPEKRGRG
jgi:hypothetical protein